VYQNGVLLKGGATDYTATSGTSVVLATGATADDVIEIIVYDAFSAANFYSRTDSDSRYVNVDGTTAVTITTTDNNPQLTLKSTDADGSSGPLLDLTRDSGSPADGDVTGIIRFRADNDAGEVTTTGQIVSLLNDASDGTEDGEMKLEVMSGGAAQSRIDIIPSETVFNEGSIDVDFRVESNGKTNMLVVDAGNDRVGIGDENPDAILHVDATSSGNNVEAMRISNTGGGADEGAFISFEVANTSGYGASIGGLREGTDGIALVARSGEINGATVEGFRLDHDHRLLVGTTQTLFDTDQVLQVSGSQACNMRSTVASADGGHVIGLQRSGNTQGDYIRFFDSSGNETGQIRVDSGGTCQYEDVSDYRLKDNIKDWDVDASAKVKQVKIRTFDWKDQTAVTNGKNLVGVIAHELQEVYPHCVTGKKDGYGEDVDKDGNKKPMYQGVDYGKLTPLLTKALQEALVRIDTLETKNDALEARIKKLEDG